jgi:hypothetical protein
MPLSKRERKELAIAAVNQYYPDTSEEDAGRIVGICVNGFIGDYSPIGKEQDHRTALGCGVGFEDFVIYVGRNVTNREPVGVDEERLGQILYGVSM